jgi:hypothetical protein
MFLMKSTGLPLRTLVIFATALLATSLSAQRYQPRDHHVFHPPVQAKHQPMSPNDNVNRTHTTSTAASTHNRDLTTFNEAGTTMRTPKAPGTEYPQPH